jgi:hypothetical protein
MPGALDLTWKVSAAESTPPAGKSSAIYRGDTYAHVLEFWNDEAETDPFTITGTVTAQIRSTRLTGATGGTPLADFAVVVSGAGSNIVTISLTSAQTLALPAAGFWDCQVDNAGTITTLLAGKVKVLDDVTREAV